MTKQVDFNIIETGNNQHVIQVNENTNFEIYSELDLKQEKDYKLFYFEAEFKVENNILKLDDFNFLTS